MATASTPNEQPDGTSASQSIPAVQPTAKPASQAPSTTKKSTSLKKPPFSDEEISKKAYELWKVRNGAAGSAENDWYAAIEDLEKERCFMGS